MMHDPGSYSMFNLLISNQVIDNKMNMGKTLFCDATHINVSGCYISWGFETYVCIRDRVLWRVDNTVFSIKDIFIFTYF